MNTLYALGLLFLVWLRGWYKYRMSHSKWIGRRNIIGFARFWYYRHKGYIIADKFYIKKGKS